MIHSFNIHCGKQYADVQNARVQDKAFGTSAGTARKCFYYLTTKKTVLQVIFEILAFLTKKLSSTDG